MQTLDKETAHAMTNTQDDFMQAAMAESNKGSPRGRNHRLCHRSQRYFFILSTRAWVLETELFKIGGGFATAMFNHY